MLLSAKDAARAVGLGVSAVYQLISQGEVASVAIGTRKYISLEVLLKFIKQNTQQGYHSVRTAPVSRRRRY